MQMNLKKAKTIALSLSVFLFLSFSVAHKFYVSVTNLVYSDDTDAFQITSRVFIDDLENVLEQRYDIKTRLATSEESKVSDFYIEKYVRTKFLVELDGELAPYTFLGKKYDNDVVIFYMEVENVELDKIKTISVQNEVLTDLFEEQQNIVHIKWKDNKKSFVLFRENNKGMLNL
ncbi:DUF6702 family protein [Flagellimonas meishanensis]|uniref:DUF6702 family protein n=1 Tax=Flagellimonas meishanensis TaxID=2873264 RepID=UPI00223B5747|nr:DUF6702 family protein [[Muricauda] meishanensis]